MRDNYFDSYIRERIDRSMSYDEIDAIRDKVTDSEAQKTLKRIRQSCIDSMREERKQVEEIKDAVKRLFEVIDEMREEVRHKIWLYECTVHGERIIDEFVDDDDE